MIPLKIQFPISNRTVSKADDFLAKEAKTPPGSDPLENPVSYQQIQFPIRNPAPSSEPTASVLTRESEWFMQEVQPHAGRLKSYLQSSFPSVRDVDDVVQESFLQMWRVRAARPITSARGLLFTIARNVALNLAQRQRSAPVCTVADLARVPAPDEQADAHESLSCADKRRLLVEALATLPPRCRQVVVMCKLQRLPQREVARTLGLSERAVESHVARAKERCVAYLHKRGIRSLHDT